MNPTEKGVMGMQYLEHLLGVLKKTVKVTTTSGKHFKPVSRTQIVEELRGIGVVVLATTNYERAQRLQTVKTGKLPLLFNLAQRMLSMEALENGLNGASVTGKTCLIGYELAKTPVLRTEEGTVLVDILKKKSAPQMFLTRQLNHVLPVGLVSGLT